jgi:hypothetical protein
VFAVLIPIFWKKAVSDSISEGVDTLDVITDFTWKSFKVVNHPQLA